MKGIDHRKVGTDEEGMRIDRWFHVHFPGVSHAHLNKLLRTGQVRLDGARVKGSARLGAGQEIRIPPMSFARRSADATAENVRPLTREERTLFQSMVLYEDQDI